MSSFFEMSVGASLGKRLDAQRGKEIDMSHVGRAHDRLKMFKAVLLGQLAQFV